MSSSRRITTVPCVVVVAAALGALVPAAALAAPTTIDRAQTSYKLTAAPGTSNAIGVSEVPKPPEEGIFEYVFTDPAGLITDLFVSCEPQEGTEIRCVGPLEDDLAVGRPTVTIDVGDGNDSVTIARGSTAPRPRIVQRLEGGPGADTLSGSAQRTISSRRPYISGGPGNDKLSSDGGQRLRGEGGIDTIDAKNGVGDFAIDCGPGNNKKEKAKRDKEDPKPVSC